MPKNKKLVTEDALSSVFEDDKREQAMALFTDMGESIVGVAQDAVDQAMMDRGLRLRSTPANKGTRLVRELKAIFDNNGVDPRTGEKWTIEDFQNVDKELFDSVKSGQTKLSEYSDVQMSREQPLLMPRVIAETVREALEPALLLTPLLQRINFSNGTSITFPAISSMMAGDLRIPERGEYPEGKLQFAGQITANIGKHGIKVSMTEEAIRYSIMDIWSMNLKAAGRALARHKEQQVVDQIFGQGTIYFDNSTLGGRKTTGRDMTGAFNGTFTQDDLFEMWADLVKDGYIPDTIMMHPFAWPIFARDPVLRNLAYINGGGPVIANAYQGAPGAYPRNGDPMKTATNLAEPANLATTSSPVPGTFPFGQIRIIITPFVDYDLTSNATDIWLFDSRDLGIMVVDEDVMTEQWNDPEHDVQSIKLRERYGLANANNGRSIRRAKSVVVTKSFDFSMSSIQASITLDTSELVVS